MKFGTRAAATLSLGISLICIFGCPIAFPGGTPDMTAPVPCIVDSDCPDGIACIFPDGTDNDGFCDVDETQVSTGAPAMCSIDEDCPDGIACVFANETEANGFCDVEETLAP
jgi:hypothetical protein